MGLSRSNVHHLLFTRGYRLSLFHQKLSKYFTENNKGIGKMLYSLVMISHSQTHKLTFDLTLPRTYEKCPAADPFVWVGRWRLQRTFSGKYVHGGVLFVRQTGLYGRPVVCNVKWDFYYRRCAVPWELVIWPFKIALGSETRFWIRKMEGLSRPSSVSEERSWANRHFKAPKLQ